MNFYHLDLLNNNIQEIDNFEFTNV